METSVYHLADRNCTAVKNTVSDMNSHTEIGGVGKSEIIWLGGAGKSAPKLDAKVIVSHLPINWRTFPFFVTLRALNPTAKIIHVERKCAPHGWAKVLSKLSKSSAMSQTVHSLFDRVVHEDCIKSGYLLSTAPA